MRLMGVLLILSSSLYTGFALSRDAGRRVRHLQALCELIAGIRAGVGTLCIPFSDLFSSYRDPILEDCGFLPLLRTLSRDPCVDGPLYRALEEAQTAGMLCLTEEDMHNLLTFAAGLGGGDSEEEAGRCAYHLTLLRERCAKAEHEAAGEIRVRRALPVSLGLLCVLLLW